MDETLTAGIPAKLPMAKTQKILAIKGMNDILPPESARWEWLEQKVRLLMDRFAYRNVRTPILEQTALFVRGIGEVTDIVEKEMYTFNDRADKNGDFDQLSLRPENTASVVRATIEHNLLYDGGKRLYYMGPMFRRERPQRGRFRQFHQIGAEALGFAGPDIDAELILLAVSLWKELGVNDWRLELNSLGQPDERARHRAQLIAYFEQHAGVLDDEARRRLHTNPLRVLDSKNPAMKAVLEDAPRLIDYLGAASRAHLDGVKAILDANDVPWTLNSRLVRGLDYYNLTVFEFVTDRLGAQGTICGGGRYDYLVEQSGGKPAPAVGWALGIERVLDLLAEQGTASQVPVADVYAVIPDASAWPVAVKTLQALRNLGVSVQMNAASSEGLGSIKSQLKRADASGARHVLIFGATELSSGGVIVKAMRGERGACAEGQTLELLAEVASWGPRLKP